AGEAADRKAPLARLGRGDRGEVGARSGGVQRVGGEIERGAGGGGGAAAAAGQKEEIGVPTKGSGGQTQMRARNAGVKQARARAKKARGSRSLRKRCANSPDRRRSRLRSRPRRCRWCRTASRPRANGCCGWRRVARLPATPRTRRPMVSPRWPTKRTRPTSGV